MQGALGVATASSSLAHNLRSHDSRTSSLAAKEEGVTTGMAAFLPTRRMHWQPRIVCRTQLHCIQLAMPSVYRLCYDNVAMAGRLFNHSDTAIEHFDMEIEQKYSYFE